MTNFFDFVNERFFSPFTSQNKVLNYDLLSLINRKMNNEFSQFSRDEVLSWLIDYLEDYPFVFIDDESGTVIDRNIKQIASDKLRYFVICGWLVDENDSRTLKTTYQMDSNAIHILDAMEDVIKSDTKPNEYTGYVYNIYSSLCNFNFEHSTDIVEQIFKNTKELIDRLRGLNVSIRKYLKKLISNDKLTPREILEQLLIEYQDKVVLKTFNNLRLRDNPAKYKNTILNKIDIILRDDNLAKMVDSYINTKKNGEKTEQNICEAKSFFYDSLDYVIEQFKSIENNLDILNNKNTKYVSTAQSRVKFLLNEEEDIEGRIIKLLKSIAETDSLVEESAVFELFELGRIDEESLFCPRTAKKKPQSVIDIQPLEIDEVELEKARKRLRLETIYNTYNVDKFIRQSMNGKTRILASEIVINSYEELVKLFLAGIYSENLMMSYKVTFTQNLLNWQGHKLTDFIIERRTK